MERLVCVLFIYLVSVQCSSESSPTAEPELAGPCRAWLTPCGNRRWTCTSEREYQQFHLGPQPGCPVTSATPGPPPGQRCEIVDGTCQFTNSTLQCATWFDSCNQVYKCGSEQQFNNRSRCGSFPVVGSEPSPNSLCLSINNTCQWYNPCQSWRGHCYSPYMCGTLDQYYAFLFGPIPLCIPPPDGYTEPTPPGKCELGEDRECSWSNCTGWLDWCRTYWFCGTQYDERVYRAGPPPPCPAPPPNYTPPPPPGVCTYNFTIGQCQFYQNEGIETTVPTSETTTTVSVGTGCELILCPPGSVCAVGDTRNMAYCDPSCDEPHASFNCGENEECILLDGNCDDNQREPCPHRVQCVHTDPCALVDCAPYYTCEVSRVTGNAVCVPSCDINNGGCREDQLCAIEEHTCQPINSVPCDNYFQIICRNVPSVPCGEIIVQDCPSNARCLVQNLTREVSCVGSCFVNNGGCAEVCYNGVKSGCSYDTLPCSSDVICTTLNRVGSGCAPGKVFKECGSYCPETCDTYLSNELTICPEVCVSGCFCPLGLVQYRDRCVDPQECYTLVKNPPPPNPLPQRQSVVLLTMSIAYLSIDDFVEYQDEFVDAIEQILEHNRYNSVQVSVYAAYMTDQLNVVVNVSGDGVRVDVGERIASLISDNSETLPLQVIDVSQLTTQQLDEDNTEFPLVGVVVGALFTLVALTIAVMATVVIILMVHKGLRRARIARVTAMNYSKMDHEESENIYDESKEVKILPDDEKNTNKV